MGRSSYYVTLAGHNLARCVVEDVIYHQTGETIRSYDEVLWTDVPVSIIRKYIQDKSLRAKALSLIKQGKYGGTFKGAGENNPRRKVHDLKMDLRNIRNYRRYFKPKEEE
jgi:D-aspartate ligase